MKTREQEKELLKIHKVQYSLLVNHKAFKMIKVQLIFSS